MCRASGGVTPEASVSFGCAISCLSEALKFGLSEMPRRQRAVPFDVASRRPLFSQPAQSGSTASFHVCSRLRRKQSVRVNILRAADELWVGRQCFSCRVRVFLDFVSPGCVQTATLDSNRPHVIVANGHGDFPENSRIRRRTYGDISSNRFLPPFTLD